MNIMLSKIHKGMTVYDQSQTEIGTVELVQYGEEDPLKPRAHTTSYGMTPEQGEWLLESNRDVFGTDQLPDLLRDRLLLYGFIRLNGPGLYDTERYILPKQIQSIDGNRITLNISKNELAQRPNTRDMW
jgi:hypothetical protein